MSKRNQAPAVVRRFTTTIQSGQCLAELVRTRKPSGMSVFFKLGQMVVHGPRGFVSHFDPPLSLIDAALAEAQLQVDDVGEPGTFIHLSPKGLQLIFKIRPTPKP